MIFRNGTGAVGFQQQFQIVHTGLQFFAFIGISHPHAGFHLFKDDTFVGDVVISVNRVPLAGEGLVGHDAVMAGIVDQGITGNAGGRLVSPAETAVDHQQLAAALDGTFSLLHLHGHMAVDDVAVIAFQAEFL